MEENTIDLTDPLEELLRRTGWTPEYLQERLVKMTRKNVKKAEEKVPLEEITLSNLLGSSKFSGSEEIQEASDCIVVSDEEDSTNRKNTEHGTKNGSENNSDKFTIIDVTDDSLPEKTEHLNLVKEGDLVKQKGGVSTNIVNNTENIINLSSDSEEESASILSDKICGDIKTDVYEEKSVCITPDYSHTKPKTSVIDREIEIQHSKEIDFDSSHSKTNKSVDSHIPLNECDIKTAVNEEKSVCIFPDHSKELPKTSVIDEEIEVQRSKEIDLDSSHSKVNKSVDSHISLNECDIKTDVNKEKSVCIFPDHSKELSKMSVIDDEIEIQRSKKVDFDPSHSKYKVNETIDSQVPLNELQNVNSSKISDNSKQIEEKCQSLITTENTRVSSVSEEKRDIEESKLEKLCNKGSESSEENSAENYTHDSLSHISDVSDNKPSTSGNDSSPKTMSQECVQGSSSINLVDVNDSKCSNPDEEPIDDKLTDSKNDVESEFEVDCNDEQESSDNLEKIRENLRLQLSNLRNRKKTNPLDEIRTRVVDAEYTRKLTLGSYISERTNLASKYSCKDKPSEEFEKSPETESDERNISTVYNEIRKIISKKKSSDTLSDFKIADNPAYTPLISTQNTNKDIPQIAKSSVDLENNSDRSMSDLIKKELGAPVTDQISPFLSNSLDEFLTDAKLNVSYEIPKCYAEEGLRQQHDNVTVMPTVASQVNTGKEKQKQENIKYKPKTLAEKRRLLEKESLKHIKQLRKHRNIEKNKHHSYVMFRDKKLFVKTKTLPKCLANIESTILPSVKKEDGPQEIKKPSLLEDFRRKSLELTKYKPGPLSKKPHLQNHGLNWSTLVKKLPRIILDVTPQINKPLPKNLLHLLPKWDGNITDSQLDFALSVVKDKRGDGTSKTCSFEIPYEHDQVYILVKKKHLNTRLISLEDSTTANIEDEVQSVMHKLLNYVEINAISPYLIKQTENIQETPHAITNNDTLVKRKKRSKVDLELSRLNCKLINVEVDENDSNQKCTKEYCTLGCVCKSLQCDTLIGMHCRKVECMFECSCPQRNIFIDPLIEQVPAGTGLLSIDTVSRIEDEAKKDLAKEEKEFTQTVICTKNRAIVVGCESKSRRISKLPKKYSNFFDEEDSVEASKDLNKNKLKTEPQCSVVLDRWDFSDIIPYCLVHSLHNCFCKGRATFKDKVIKEEVKKSVKIENIPKKQITINKTPNVSIDNMKKEKPEESLKNDIRKAAIIKKEHNIDNGQTLYSVTGRPIRKNRKIYDSDFVCAGTRDSTRSDDKQDSDNEKKFIRPLKSPKTKFIELPQNVRNKRKAMVDTDNTPYSEQNKKKTNPYSNDLKIENVCDKSTLDCSRTNGSVTYSNTFKKFSKLALKNDFVNVTQLDLSPDKDDKRLSESDKLKIELVENKKTSSRTVLRKSISTDCEQSNCISGCTCPTLTGCSTNDNSSSDKKRKRKQEMLVRSDDIIEIKDTSPPQRQRIVNPVFDGEIIVRDGQLKLTEDYARILPWSALLQGFISRKINVYCIFNSPLKLVITKGVKMSGLNVKDIYSYGKKFVDIPIKSKNPSFIRQSENVQDIIKWLLSGILPLTYEKTSLAFLLVQITPHHFEVRGICTQKVNNTPKNDKWINSRESIDFSDQIVEVKHRGLNNIIGSLFIKKAMFPLKDLFGEFGYYKKSLLMSADLPGISDVEKWRVVFLNEKFEYLYFKNVNYSIKYIDLLRLTALAKEHKYTLILKNNYIRRCSTHNLFGLYISRKYSDRIFIGPYQMSDYSEDVETLKLINKSLVSKESLNKMKGMTATCGCWMYEPKKIDTPTPTQSSVEKPSSDLKKESSTELSPTKNIKTDKNETSEILNVSPRKNLKSKNHHILVHKGYSITIRKSKPRSPTEFNRFLITNIPQFGYLGAYQLDDSNILEVSWPFEEKVLQFKNSDHALDFLLERFNQLLQPVPETFRIQIKVLFNLDLEEYKPVDAKVLNGHCICGDFGTYNFKELTDEFCRTELKISKAEITQLFSKRAQAYIIDKIQDLADLVGLNQFSDRENYNMRNILSKAKEVIKTAESRNRELFQEITKQETKLAENVTYIRTLASDLPEKYRNIESCVLNDTLQIRPSTLNSNEVVEIIDDNEPDEVDDVIWIPEESNNADKSDTKKEQPTDVNSGQNLTNTTPECGEVQEDSALKTPVPTLRVKAPSELNNLDSNDSSQCINEIEIIFSSDEDTEPDESVEEIDKPFTEQTDSENFIPSGDIVIEDSEVIGYRHVIKL
ncbi:uncharacterized protein LOC115887501 [Sitophilus oryzae]|uniref:Uncharacterized protein LOC115887501 n=1 Tax=Sitophilus oryzae TaxID=7048 RepID=A0A6J2YHF1_SITOR|nr:uncharacterized protein LOC115887501 [Sitophilus oryzae]XP_030762918.1 uncharacterized protein LOC115887501 [Sitophilus oryzae]